MHSSMRLVVSCGDDAPFALTHLACRRMKSSCFYCLHLPFQMAGVGAIGGQADQSTGGIDGGVYGGMTVRPEASLSIGAGPGILRQDDRKIPLGVWVYLTYTAG